MTTTRAKVPGGRFITLEGIEGVGKSTNVEVVASLLRAAGHEVVVTREPGGTALGERIRDILLAPAGPMVPMSELLLMFAARAAHVAEVISPALAAGRWVVCDRFTDASYAYQGGGRGLPAATIAALESVVLGSLRPDLTLLLDVSLEVSVGRQRERGSKDRFEREGPAFFERVRAAYLTRSRLEPGRVRVIDAAAPLHVVRQEIARHLRVLLGDNA